MRWDADVVILREVEAVGREGLSLEQDIDRRLLIGRRAAAVAPPRVESDHRGARGVSRAPRAGA